MDGIIWKWLDLSGFDFKCWKWLKIAGTVGKGIKWLEMTGLAGNGWKWPEQLKWLKMAGNNRKYSEMAKHSWKWLN